MDNKRKTTLGFTDLLAVLFIGLKLTHHIQWSWIWVLAPIWILIIMAVIIVAITD